MNYQKERERILKNVFTITYNKTMKFKSIYDACAELMYEEEIPYKVIIGGKQMTILVYGNGTYELIK
jgi:hypothetical protein